MTTDLNKGITGITYNLLTLPKQLDMNNNIGRVQNKYTYLADGRKIKVEQLTGSSLTTQKTTDYAGNRIYENGTLKCTLVDGGYVEGSNYFFYLNDHLGNNRLVVQNSVTGGKVVQKNHYYPFGMTFAETSDVDQNVQRYKYNGKELDRTMGLNLYDYGARYYEPAIGRFTTMDPLAEKYYSWSPYGYCAGNPILNIDPDGKDWYSYINKDGILSYGYNANTHSQKELDKVVNGAKYLGRTWSDGNNYFSLFGSIKDAKTIEGKIYQLLDKAIISDAKAKIEGLKTRIGETAYTDFTIEGISTKNTRMLGIDSHRNEYTFDYENSNVGIYRVYSGTGMMVGQMENWVGHSDMPKHIGDWKSGPQRYHILFKNKGGTDIIHLQYNKENAERMIHKYYQLFPQLNQKK